MTAVIVPAALQDIGKAGQIGINIGMRNLERISHARLRRQMDHDRKPVAREQMWNCDAIRHIQVFEPKAGIASQNVQPGRLQLRIIIRIEIVEPDNAMAGPKQSLRHVESNEASGSRYQDWLIRHHHHVLTQYGLLTAPWVNTPAISAGPRRNTGSPAA